MNRKHSSLLIMASLFVSVSAFGISCEKVSDNYFCETIFHAGSTYVWSTTGDIGVSSSGGPFAVAYCDNGSGAINVAITSPSGNTTSSSTSINCTSPPGVIVGPINVCHDLTCPL